MSRPHYREPILAVNRRPQVVVRLSDTQARSGGEHHAEANIAWLFLGWKSTPPGMYLHRGRVLNLPREGFQDIVKMPSVLPPKAIHSNIRVRTACWSGVTLTKARPVS